MLKKFKDWLLLKKYFSIFAFIETIPHFTASIIALIVLYNLFFTDTETINFWLRNVVALLALLYWIIMYYEEYKKIRSLNK